MPRWIVLAAGAPSSVAASSHLPPRGVALVQAPFTLPDASTADRLTRRLAKRRPHGILLCLSSQDVFPSPTGAVLPRLLRHCPGVPVVVLIVDPTLPSLPTPFGGPCPAHGDAPVEHLLGLASRQLMGGLSASGDAAMEPEALLLPSLIRDRAASWSSLLEAAVPHHPLTGLHVMGDGDVPASLPDVLSAYPAQEPALSRSPFRPGFGAAASGMAVAGLAASAAIWWSIDETGRTLAHQSALLHHAEQTAPDRLSHAGLSAASAVVELLDHRDTRLPLVPSSWSNEVGILMHDQLSRALPAILLNPVRDHLAARHDELAPLAAPGSSLPAPQARAALVRAITLRTQFDRFQLAGEAPPHQQWAALVRDVAPQGPPVTLDWLKGETGEALLAAELARYGWRPPALASLAEGILAAAERHAAQQAALTEDWRQRTSALHIRFATALAHLSGREGLEEDRLAEAVSELARALSDLRLLGHEIGTHLETLSADHAALLTMRAPTVAAGLLPPVRWDAAENALNTAVQHARDAMLGLHLADLGPLLVQRDSQLAVAAPIVAGGTALSSLVEEGIVGASPRDMPPIGPLSMQSGPPDPDRLARAAGRITAFQSWQDAHARRLPDSLQRPVLRFAMVNVAINAAIDAAEAYQASPTPDSSGPPVPYDAAIGRSLAPVLEGLSRLAPGVGRDIAWIAGVRAYRDLEILDRAFEAHNVFHLSPVVETWQGRGSILAGAGWNDSTQRKAHLMEGWRRMTQSAAAAAPLLDILTLPGVSDELDSPRLIEKWTAMQTMVAAGPQAITPFETLIGTTLAGFDTSDCGQPGLMPVDHLHPGVLRDEADKIAQALASRCKDLLNAPLPLRKPVPPVKRAHSLVPW